MQVWLPQAWCSWCVVGSFLGPGPTARTRFRSRPEQKRTRIEWSPGRPPRSDKSLLTVKPIDQCTAPVSNYSCHREDQLRHASELRNTRARPQIRSRQHHISVCPDDSVTAWQNSSKSAARTPKLDRQKCSSDGIIESIGSGNQERQHARSRTPPQQTILSPFHSTGVSNL